MTVAVDTKFNFKARNIVGEDGKVIGKGKKQPAVNVAIPVPTAEELIAILSRPDQVVKEEGKPDRVVVDKEKQLLLDSAFDIVKGQARSQFDEAIESFGDDTEKVVTPDMLDFDKLSLRYIAYLEPGQRGARAIPQEDYDTFYDDYMQVMVAATGKPEKKIGNQVEIFKKPTRAKGSKDICNLLVEQIDVYLISSAAVEDTGEVAGRLRAKFDKWSKEEVKLTLDAL